MNRLEEICEALYGERWQSALAQDLGVEARSVRRWMAGDHPCRMGVARHQRLCFERLAVLKRLEKSL